ncbi:MAG: hypothetical protein OZSIB_2957 [Candidatus Ozemobacter sibiricus]|uniref:Uncharacterized protein n=1 Tax=Candidatus Ozemobacter sibiricus TaxID=2268124 RepID=A0A367ZR69_9BACT|nr:MAG: hypothetical protein OZSIB_2957 [Candidatus Ozemobacter sibiricus]
MYKPLPSDEEVPGEAGLELLLELEPGLVDDEEEVVEPVEGDCSPGCSRSPVCLSRIRTL